MAKEYHSFCHGTGVPRQCWLWYIIVSLINILMRFNTHVLEL